MLERHLAGAGIGVAPPDATAMASCLVARLCHDLAGGVSACVSGAELLADEDDPAARRELAGALEIAANRMAARVRFFRFVFGAGDDTAALCGVEAARIAADMLADRPKLRLDWLLTDGPVVRGRVRLLLALALTVSEAISTGVITIEHGGVTARAGSAAVSPDVRAIFERTGAVLSAKSAVALFAVTIAGAEGNRIAIEADAGMLRLVIV